MAKRTTQTGEVYFYSTDHLGSTVLVTNHIGQEVWSGDASPFGESVSETGELIDSEEPKYTGKDFDGDVGLYYFNARWYDAHTGRFISEDPARDGSNWYAYVSNNPLKYIDPTGLRNEEWESKWKQNQEDAQYKGDIVTGSDGALEFTIDKGGCAVTLSANLSESIGQPLDPGEANLMNQDNDDEGDDWVSGGNVQWENVAETLGLSVEREDDPFTVEMFEEQGADEDTSFWTGIRVPWNQKDDDGQVEKAQHWVGVNDTRTDEEGNNYFVISETSINDTHVEVGTPRAGMGWMRNPDNDTQILIPESRVMGYVIFSRPIE